MNTKVELKGSKELEEEVVKQGLCIFCGACIGMCPYNVAYRGRRVVLEECPRDEGRCYAFCPRTHTDMDAVSQKIFGVPFGEGEIGVVKEAFLAKATDPEIHEKGQDGGVVTALLSVAISEGIIDAAVETKMSEDKRPVGFLARNREELLQCAGVSYEPSPVLEALNRIPNESDEKLGIVGLPCHVAALAKMRAYPFQDYSPLRKNSIGNVKLVLGLFCGWSLANGFYEFMEETFDLSQVTKFDIPHHPGHTFDAYTRTGKQSVEIEEIRQFINSACGYCWDMTSEFADISAGSGRAKFRGWNTVLVRSERGAELVDIARKKGVIETQPLPEESLINLKKAALNKKKRAVNSIIAKTGVKENLLYLGLSKEMINKLLD